MIEAASDSGAAQVVAPDDGGVIDALRRGDEGAFARLVDQYHPSLRRVARLYIANRAVADEVVQDTWLGVIQGIWAFERRSSLKTWIFRILINRAKTRERARVGCLIATRFRALSCPRLPCRAIISAPFCSVRRLGSAARPKIITKRE